MRNVVVTTKDRGVFFGELEHDDPEKDELELTNVQMCVYWDESVRGVLGLAATGPSKKSRITRAIPKIKLFDITSVMDATDEAATAWRSCPWN